MPTPSHPQHRTRTARLVAAAISVLAALTTTACSSSSGGELAVAVDPAGRLLAVVALCDGQSLHSLVLTDETTGTSTSVREPAAAAAANSSAPGATIVLTAPITEPHIEGVLDLLDRTHVYTVHGQVGADSSDEAGTTTPTVRFKLSDVLANKALRQGSVLAAGGESPTTVARADFVTRVRNAC